MINPIFLDVRGTKGLVNTDVELLQLSAIGGVTLSSSMPNVYITSPRDQESAFVLRFETNEARDFFIESLRKMLGRKATVVTV